MKPACVRVLVNLSNLHNRLTHQPQLHHWLHGEKVGYSLLVQLLIEHDGEPDAELLALLRQYAMPLTLAALTGDDSPSCTTD